jgi:hypothetical protein
MRLERQRSDGRKDFWEAKVDKKKHSIDFTSGIVNVKHAKATKTYASSKQLTEALAKLVKAKRHAGFKEPVVIGSQFLPDPLPTNPTLEAAIREDRSAGACGVYADWLQAQESPIGEWIALAAALEQKRDPRKAKRHEELTAELVLPTAKFATWGTKHGFFEWLRLENSEDWMDSAFAAVDFAAKLFATPLCAALDELRIGILRWDHNSQDVPAVLKAAGKHAWSKSLSRLSLGDVSRDIDMAHHVIGEVGAVITKSFPALRSLKLHSGAQDWRDEGETFSVDGLALPELETLVIETCAMTKHRLLGVMNAKLPKLTTLELWFGGVERDADANAKGLARLLSGKAFPAVTKLALKNHELAADLIPMLATSPLAAQLETLDLSMSTLDATTAPLLAEIADRFPKLKTLDVSDNFLVEEDIGRIVGAFKQADVVSGTQGKLEYAEEDRYASVLE